MDQRIWVAGVCRTILHEDNQEWLAKMIMVFDVVRVRGQEGVGMV
jgi:hypothetical protein